MKHAGEGWFIDGGEERNLQPPIPNSCFRDRLESPAKSTLNHGVQHSDVKSNLYVREIGALFLARLMEEN